MNSKDEKGVCLSAGVDDGAIHGEKQHRSGNQDGKLSGPSLGLRKFVNFEPPVDICV